MNKIFALFLFCSLWSCDDRKVDASKWKKELKSHKFVKVTDGEIAADAATYTELVTHLLDSLNLLDTVPYNDETLDSIIHQIELAQQKVTGVKLCFVKQDNLESCYPSVTRHTTPKDTINKIAEIWDASKGLALQPEIYATPTPQFLNDGSIILSTYPVFANGQLAGLWCMLFKRQIIVLNRIE